MAPIKELPPLPFYLNVTHGNVGYLFPDKAWNPSTGVAAVDFTVDLQRLFVGEGAAVALKPAMQFAPTRTDRPDEAAVISAGNDITAPGPVHFQETLSASTKFFFRGGLGFKLTSGSFARVEGLLYTAFRSLGVCLPTEEILFNPANSTTAVHYFPLGRQKPIPASKVASAKLVVITVGNRDSNTQWRLAARVFNDPVFRGAWTDLENDWHGTPVGNFDVNTGEVSLSSLSVNSYQWLELALAVRKSDPGDPNSRSIFHVLPAQVYT
jgi:hypothetical protein